VTTVVIAGSILDAILAKNFASEWVKRGNCWWYLKRKGYLRDTGYSIISPTQTVPADFNKSEMKPRLTIFPVQVKHRLLEKAFLPKKYPRINRW
jgi:hypothetical protein